MREHNEGDLVICIVKDIVKTTVLVETEDGRKGSINFSEVAPGRIRNIRDYVIPNKVIICKVLSVSDGYLFLSLRRVKEKERKEVMDIYKKEKSIESIIKKFLGSNAQEKINKIKEEYSLIELFERAKENKEILKKYFSNDDVEKISLIINNTKIKEKEVKKEFSITCKLPNGISIIKSILSPYENIYYLGGSRFMIREKSPDLKQASSKINHIIENIEREAKKNKCHFELKK
ncbi:MAG: hypothetical protein QXJ28_02515 [Candidatus Pacearchaeota archaeon]